MLLVQTSLEIKAPSKYLFSLYQDLTIWDRLFPITIKEARLLKEEDGKLVISVQHKKAGKVINILSVQSDREIRLEEFKPVYDAVLINRFQQLNARSLYTIIAEIRFKSFFKIVEPFIKSIVERRIKKFVLKPMQDYAEAHYQN